MMNKYRKLLAKILVTAFLFTATFVQGAPVIAQTTAKSSADRGKTELIVKYKAIGNSDKVRSDIKTKLGLSRLDLKHKMRNAKIELLQIGSEDNLTNTINELKKNSNVEYVQPNYILKTFGTGADEQFDDQWGLLNNGQTVGLLKGIEGIDINAEEAWDITEGSSSSLIGVLDTGIDINHNDLKNKIYVNPGDIPGNNLDDDGNGYIDDVNGWDFSNGDNSVFDSASVDKHGTHVAGIIAAQSGNGGIKGVAPGVKVLPLKFISDGTGYTSDAINAIEYAKQMGVKVINCSFGGADNNTALKDAMSASGILFVCAAGNDGKDTASNPVYPASFKLNNIISVASVDNSGKLAIFSNYGTDVNIAAPGVNIISTVPSNKYELINGTSVAAPFITGISALLQSKYPDMSAVDMKGRITTNVTTSSGLTGKVSSGGIADAYGALAGDTPIQDDSGNTTPGAIKNTGKGSAVSTLAATVDPKVLEAIHFGEKGVNPGTGNYSKSITDISVASPGFQVNIARTYNSKDDRTTGLTMGRGWTFGFEGSVKDDTQYPTQFKIAKLPNGSTQVFVKNADGTFKANDSRSKLEYSASSTIYTLTTKDQYTYGFNSAGYLIWMKDRNGNAINISVDSNGRVQKVTDTVGRDYSVGYNASNYITSVTDPMGRKMCYEYNASNLMTKSYMKTPSGTTDGAVTLYEYDASNYLTSVKVNDPSSGKTRVLETIAYNHAAGADQHKVVLYTDEFSNASSYTYTSASGTYTATIKDTTGRQYVKTYDSSFYIIESKDPENKSTYIAYNFYSDTRNVFGEEKETTDRNGNKTTYDRDANTGNILKITYPDKSIEEFSYDDKNNLIMEKDRNGNRTYYVYDAQKVNLIKKAQPLNGTDEYTLSSDQNRYAITTYTYYSQTEAQQMGCNVNGMLKSVTDPAGGVTRYTYDKYGYQKTVTDADSHTTTNSYNILGWLTTTYSPSGNKTDFEYDNSGRLLKTILDNGETTRFIYDSEGRKIQEIRPNEYKSANSATDGTVYTYYANNGKLKSINQRLSDSVIYATQFSYDIYGNIADEIKPNGSVYYYDYDSLNRLNKVAYSDNISGAAIVLEEYAYSILSGGQTQKTYTKYLTSTETAVTKYTYDYADRLIEQVNPDGGKFTTEYNPNGTVLSSTDGNGNTTWFKYDGLSRLTGKWTPVDSGNYLYNGYEYDKAGRVTVQKSGKDQVELNDIPAADRLIYSRNVYTPGGKTKTVSSSSGSKTTFAYDADGNLAKENTYTSETKSNVTEYEYNHLGKPIVKKVHVLSGDIVGYNEDDTTDIELVTRYTYDKNGNLLTVTTPDGTTTKYTYDAFDRQTSVSQPGLDENSRPATITSRSEYEWNNKVKKTIDAKGYVTEYAYTPRGFLKTITKKSVTDIDNTTPYDCITEYNYDLAGRKIIEVSPKNRTTASTLTLMDHTEFIYDKMDRLKAQKEVLCIYTEVLPYQVKHVPIEPIGPKEIYEINFYIRILPYKTYEISYSDFVSKAFKYDYNGNVIKELSGEGYAAGSGSSVDAKINNGYGTIYTYNGFNKVTTVLDAVSADKGLQYSQKIEYDGAGRKLSEENGNGAVTCYTYDDNGNLLATAVKKGTGAPAQTTKSATYDFAGNVKTQSDGNGNVTTFEYNALDKVKKAVYPGDSSMPQNTIIYRYDKMGSLAISQEADGSTNLYTYDRQGRELSRTRQDSTGKNAIKDSRTYDVNGNVVKEIDGNGVLKTNSYDQLNRLTGDSIIVKTHDNRSVNHLTKYKYDRNDNKIKEVTYLNENYQVSKWEYYYDPFNRLTSKKDPTDKIIQTLEYNRDNAQINSKDGNSNVTSFEYDKNGRMIATIDPSGHAMIQMYDNAGNIALKTDGNGMVTKYKYDQFNRLISVTNAKNETTAYIYDLNGNMLVQTDGKGNATLYEYNAGNKLLRKIDAGGRTGSQGKYTYNPDKTEQYTYYADGNMHTKLDRNGVTTTYTYDVHGRLLSQTADDSKISYTYDDNGNQLSMTDSTGTTRRSYDELNRVIMKNVPNFGVSTFKYDISSQTGWAAAWKVGEESTDPKGNKTLKINDAVGRLAAVKDNADTTFTVYEYDTNGNRTSITYPNGATETYTYYDDNLLKTLTNKIGGAISSAFSYEYDAAHNQTKVVDDKGTTSYSYDELNRLKKVVDYSSKATEYTFDKAGNRLTETETTSGGTATTSYSYNEQNRLLTTTVLNNGKKEITSYSYDNNGNMTQRTVESTKQIEITNPPKAHFGMFVSGQTTGSATEYAEKLAKATAYYSYDVWNQLVKVTTGTQTEAYVYNGDGLRIQKTSNGAVTRYLYEYDKVVLETNEKGKTAARNVYGTNLISRNADGERLYYMYNGHADVTSLIDNTRVRATYYYDAFGTIVEEKNYDVGGNVIQTGAGTKNSIRYAGYQYDSETGLYYLNARYYDSKIARFLSEDTFSGYTDDPLSLNLYTYCFNNPIRYWDPTGHLVHQRADGIWEDDNTGDTWDHDPDAWNIPDTLIFTPTHDGNGNWTGCDISGSGTLDNAFDVLSNGNITVGANVTIGNMEVRDNGWINLNNFGQINRFNSGVNSNTTIINNYFGTINTINFGVKSTNLISNYSNGVIGTIHNAGRTNTVITDYGYIGTAERGAGLSSLSVNGTSYKTFNGSIESLACVKWNRVDDFLSFLDAEWTTIQYSAADWKKFFSTIKQGNFSKLYEENIDSFNETTNALPEGFIVKGSLKIAKESPDFFMALSAFIGKKLGKNADELIEGVLKTGKWGKGSFDDAAKSLEYHFQKHGKELGAKDIEQYLRKAEEFAKDLKGATKKQIGGSTSGVTRYYKNGKYIDIASDKTIISFGKQ